jgi:O-acetylserine/cysteine efflux transporter
LRPLHVVLALVVAIIWGEAFIATKFGLGNFSPLQLMIGRFLIASIPAIFLPRPDISWGNFILIGLTLFTGQFAFQFFGMVNGTPPGLSAVIVQAQAFVTVLLSALMLGERPTATQAAGMLMVLAGLVMVGTTAGNNLTITGFILSVCSAMSWGVGNVLVKRVGSNDVFSLMAWLSFVPLVSALFASFVVEGPDSLLKAALSASAVSLSAVAYLGILATLIAYAIWGTLLRLYPSAVIVPFALLVPCVGAFSSAVIFDERFEPLRLTGMVGMVVGVAVIVLPFKGFIVFLFRHLARIRLNGLPPEHDAGNSSICSTCHGSRPGQPLKGGTSANSVTDEIR